MEEADNNVARCQAWLDSLDVSLASGDIDAAGALFNDESYWRDLVSLTWNIFTAEGRESIETMLNQVPALPSSFRVISTTDEGDSGVIGCIFTFATDITVGKGHLRLRADDGKLRAWTMLTTMEALRGHEPTRHQPQQETAEDQNPYVVIVGGGQGGIALGAHLKALNVPAVILEKNQRAGDSWKNRYSSLVLHDPVWYDHMPFIPFPDNWPVFTPKDMMAMWLESYVKMMGLDYQTETEVLGAAQDADTGLWTVNVACIDLLGRTTKKKLHPRHLIIATGMSGAPNLPIFLGQADFLGSIHHSSVHRDSSIYAGKRCVVLGSNTSAHDISLALVDSGAESVVMVQRSPTTVVRSEALMELGLGGLYSEEAEAKGIDTNTADLLFASIPYRVLPSLQAPIYAKIAARDADYYTRLESAGFMLDWGEDSSGLFMKYLRRGAGYYIDVGASERIIDKTIGLESGTTIERIKEYSIVLENGKELPADLLVLATGYGNMIQWVARYISEEVADTVGPVWGLGSETMNDPGPWEGEERNMWKPTKQSGLWFMGGNLHQARHYSKFLALQIKARFEGVATEVYPSFA